MGDYNIDGYPDILVIMAAKVPDRDNPDVMKALQRAFLLENVPCTDATCKKFGRTFSPVADDAFDRIDDIIMAAFFDIHEDVSWILREYSENSLQRQFVFGNFVEH